MIFSKNRFASSIELIGGWTRWPKTSNLDSLESGRSMIANCKSVVGLLIANEIKDETVQASLPEPNPPMNKKLFLF